MAESALRDVRIIGRDEAGQGVFVVLAGAEAPGGQDLADAAVEAFDHAVCLGVCGLDEPVLHAAPGPGGVKRMFAGGFALAARAAAVGEFPAVVGQYLGNLEGSAGGVTPEKALGAATRFLGVDPEVDPTRGAVDGCAEVAARKALREAGIARVLGKERAQRVERPVEERYGYTEAHRRWETDQRYPSCLSDMEWDLVGDLFEREGGKGRPAPVDRRALADACR